MITDRERSQTFSQPLHGTSELQGSTLMWSVASSRRRALCLKNLQFKIRSSDLRLLSINPDETLPATLQRPLFL
ncbi:hypothetical protein AAHA92_27512 [Salvia divinorum]|uniref:Uncharacterized protein n=1 Tax=Salvia divinorum TaxID=28513 RepID=A0ABD1G3X3_SALDI